MGRTRSPHNLAKMIAYVLGRRPDEFGLVPDAEGFVKVKELLKALHEEEGWGYVNLSHLNEILLSIPGPPFELADNRVRARDRDALTAAGDGRPPPKLLYAGIRRKAHPFVHANGIQPSSHPQVVLAADRGLAERLGRRIDPDPVILTVNVQAAAAAGVVFRPAGESLFLAEHVPPGCFTGPALPQGEPEPRAQRPPQEASPRPNTPGSFWMDPGKAAPAHVPESLKRGAAKGRKPDRNRLKQGKWKRETPPWKK